MRKVLGINISHNVSFAYFENNVLKEYYEEDRFNKEKNFTPPDPFYKKYEYIGLKKFKDVIFDNVVIVSFDRGHHLIERPYVDNILEQIKYKNSIFYQNEHHLSHAMSGYYFSNFKEAIALVTDGGGERLVQNVFQTVESIIKIDDNTFKKYYQAGTNVRADFWRDDREIQTKYSEKNEDSIDIKLTNAKIAGIKYSEYMYDAGFNINEEGQLMGVAAYKNKNTNIDKNVLEIANKAQEETLQDRIELIEKALTYSNCKNIILTGGYHLNCANNFKLVKHFPNLNFFVDPIPYDGGTAVGIVYYHENYI
jgi:predicted NodU family carbamoyl transferase